MQDALLTKEEEEYLSLDENQSIPSKKSPKMNKFLIISISIISLVGFIAIVATSLISMTNHAARRTGLTQQTRKGTKKEGEPRTYLSLDSWNFTKTLPEDMKFDKPLKDTTPINLPHTWNNFDGQDGGDDYARIAAAYQKSIYISGDYHGKRIFIEFFGVSIVGTVYVNGELIGKHVGAFATFRFDITDQVYYEHDNLITVIANNTLSSDYYPHEADFTFFGGMYRKANIVIVSNSHFDMLDYGSPGLYITPKVDSEKGQGILNITTLYVLEKKDMKFKMSFTVTDSDDKVIINKIVENQGYIETIIDNPHLWNGKADPYLYKAKVELMIEDTIVDRVSHHFGFRTMKLDRNGFFLNHKRLQLNGVSKHQDREDKGWAISDEDEEEDFELINEMGVNAVRFAHYQQNQSVFNICDRRGFIVWVEVPFIQKYMNTATSNENIKQQYTELIKQNYNHPCVAMWGLMNELADDGHKDSEIQILKEMADIQRKIDPSRITTGAITPNILVHDSLAYVPDVVGQNIYYGWYYGVIDDANKLINDLLVDPAFHPLAISEYGGDANIKLHSDNPKAKDYSEEYQLYLHIKTYEIFMKKGIWGTFIWNMFEFAVDSRNEGGVKGRNNKGMVTYDRKIKKETFYYYKAMWSDEPFVHVCGVRFHDRATLDINVTITSNQKKVDVYLNDNLVFSEKEFNKYQVFRFYLKEGINIVKAISGDLEHSVEFEKVDEPNPDYVLH